MNKICKNKQNVNRIKKEKYLYFFKDRCNNVNSIKYAFKIGTTKNINKRTKQHESTGVKRIPFYSEIEINKIQNEIIKLASDADSALLNLLWQDEEIRTYFWWSKNNKDKNTINAAFKDGISLDHDETLWPKDTISDNDAEKLLKRKIEYIIHYENDINKKNPIKLAPFQENIFVQALNYLNEKYNLLLYCAPRDGKSLMFIRLCKELNKKYIIIISWHIADESFKNELQYRGYEKYNFCSYKSSRFKNIINKHDWKEYEIIYISAQTFQKLTAKELAAFKQCDFIGLDEIHNGTDTVNFNAQFNLAKLNQVQQIHMSGTPYNDLLGGRYAGEQWKCINHSIIDRINDKANAKETDIFTKNFPNINMFIVESIHNIARKLYYTEFDESDEFSWEKFINNTSKLNLKTFCKQVIEGDKQNSKYEGWDFYTLPNIIETYNTKNIFISLDKITGVDRLYEIFQELQTEYNQLNIIALTGKYSKQATNMNISSTAYVNDTFNQNKNKYNIVLTVNAGLTGKTYPAGNCFLFLRNLKSAEKIDQDYCRVLTPDKNKKDVVIIFADAQQSSIAIGQLIDSIYYSAEQDHNLMKNKLKNVINNKCLNIFKEDMLSFKEYDFNQLISIHNEYIRSAPLINFNYLIQKINDNQINILSDIKNITNFKNLNLLKFNKCQLIIGKDKKTKNRRITTTINKSENEVKNKQNLDLNTTIILTICQNLALIRAYLIHQYGCQNIGCSEILQGNFPAQKWWKTIKNIQITTDPTIQISGSKFYDLLKDCFTIKGIESIFKRISFLEKQNEIIY